VECVTFVYVLPKPSWNAHTCKEMDENVCAYSGHAGGDFHVEFVNFGYLVD
jgi:hypothetical protein